MDEWVKGSSQKRELNCSDSTILQQLEASDSALEFYDPSEDISNSLHVLSQHQEPIESTLSCPYCFLPCCYNPSASFQSTSSVHTTLNQLLSTSSPLELSFSVHCAACSTHLGVFEVSTATYHFFHVLPSDNLNGLSV